MLLLAPSSAGAVLLQERIRACLSGAAEDAAPSGEHPSFAAGSEPAALAVHAFCARLLRSEAVAADLDPFFAIATRADRVAMLLGASRARRRRGGSSPPEERLHMPGTPRAALRAIEKIDSLKDELIDARGYAATVFSDDARQTPAEASATEAARSFAEVYLEHERLLAEREALDAGGLLVHALELLADADARTRLGERYTHALVDDAQDAGPALRALLDAFTGAIGDVTLAIDSDAEPTLARSYPDARVVALPGSRRCPPRMLDAARGALLVASAQPSASDSIPAPAAPAAERSNRASWTPFDEVAFWRCADERDEAHAIAAEIERLLGGDPRAASSIGILVRSIEREGRSLAGALRERAIPYRVRGASELYERSEVRDLLAWMRLLADPLDRNAAVRLLMRPPVELRHVDLARVVQLARRRKLDMPSALRAALDSPQLPPEARDRIASFVATYEELAGALEELRPDELARRLIDRGGLRRARLLDGTAEELDGLAAITRIEELARHLALFKPDASGREFAAYVCDAAEAGLPLEELVPEEAEGRARSEGAAVSLMRLDDARAQEFEHVFLAGLGGDEAAGMGRSLYLGITRAHSRAVLVFATRDATLAPQGALAAAEAARAAIGGRWEDVTPALECTDALRAAARMLRRELLDDVGRIGGRLGELRLDTGEDISHGVVRYLELLKLAALQERPSERSLADALPDLNTRLLAACTPLERELFAASELDAALLSTESQSALPGAALPGAAASASQIPPLAGQSSAAAPADSRLAAFLPRSGGGLLLSASDIASYRSCPLRYKFARVLRIPVEPTPQQRFGIMVHKVLERYHSEWDGVAADFESTLPTLMRLLDAAWRRAGFRESPGELALLERARTALVRYHEQLAEQPASPVWFERSFSFSVGRDLVRGRVDRVDRMEDGRYELIDYKTGHPRTPGQLEGDIQLSLYALAAARAWNVTAARLAYYYVLDNRKVPLPGEPDAASLGAVEAQVAAVADGVRALNFAPQPSYPVCSGCDFLDICPAAET
jgi:DNA helicase-2/ATP-dependent DNA helicase PcrA